ncbi:MAG: hypothetical protein DMD86_10260 [Candidatus Rokuibacteriota bacterium]|nr:MAG: hypothetical protein DMD86_10260 [Candidatus Rokubacteria bacterium]
MCPGGGGRTPGRERDGRVSAGRLTCEQSTRVHQGQVRGAHRPGRRQGRLDGAWLLQSQGELLRARVVERGKGEHTHPVHIIVTMIVGRMEFIIAGQRFVVEPGDELLYPAHAVHSARNLHDGASHMMESSRW